MSVWWQAARSFPSSLWRLYTSLVLVISVSMGLQAVLLNLYLLRLGFDAGYIGLLAGLGQLVWAAACLPAVLVSNRIGLRNSFQLGLAFGGSGLAIMLSVEALPQSLWLAWLLGGQVVMNTGLALATVNMPPYMMAICSERQRPQAFSLVAALIPLAALAGSVVAGFLPLWWAAQLGVTLDQPQPYRLALWFGPFLSWIAILPLVGADPGHVEREISSESPKPAPEPGTDSRTEPGTAFGQMSAVSAHAPWGLLAFWGLLVTAAAVGEGTVRTFFNLFLNQELSVAPDMIGLVMGASQVLPIAAALALPLALTRWGAGRTLGGGLLAMAGCLALLALAGGAWSLAAAYIGAVTAYIGAMVTFTVAGTARDLFGQEMVLPAWRTSSQAVGMLGLGLGYAIVGVGGGMLLARGGYTALYWAGMLAALLAVAMLSFYLRAGFSGKRQLSGTRR
jgi:MFS family permease